MREILPAKSAVQKICSIERIESGEYVSSIYRIDVPCDEGLLIYHILTGELLLLSSEEAKREKSDESIRLELIRHRFLVRKNLDEHQYARQFLEISKMLIQKKKKITGFTIFTTTDCNARCPYCYEKGRPRTHMSDAVARDAADYIYRVSGSDKVNLAWFGGEPLYNARAIDIITEELRSRGILFQSSMVSNGYLFDDEITFKAKNHWGLNHVQITLDGREEAYNRIKDYIYLDGDSAYQRVLCNIKRLLDADIHVSIRLNANSANMDDLSALVDELSKKFMGYKKLSVYSGLLHDFSTEKLYTEQDANDLHRWDALQHKIIAYGMGGSKQLPRSLQVNSCMADNDAKVTILPNGQLGKCEHESERLLIGNIYDGITENDMVAHWKEQIRGVDCLECPVFPICTRLRMCSWTKGKCTEYDRTKIRMSLIQSIVSEYKYSLEAQKVKGGELDETETEFAFSEFGK